MSELEIIRNEVKNMRPNVERKDIKRQIFKDVMPEVADIKNAHKIKAAKAVQPLSQSALAKTKREISMDMQSYTEWSTDFDFIEEACGSGEPTFEFYDIPQEVSEGVEKEKVSYPIIGKASGVFAPIGVMSRNNRIYEDDHYPYLLENQQLMDRILHRGMLGTIGHHNKKVDDDDLANGRVSHVVTDLHIKEEPDGSRNLYGTLEILDTPAGHLLKTYYDSGLPLFVSSRGGGRLTQNPHETFKRVDKTKYFLETFDIVKNPGFLQAKPVYEKVSECAEEVDAPVETQPTEEIVEKMETQPDKLDRLTEALTKFVEMVMEAKDEKIKEESPEINIEGEEAPKEEPKADEKDEKKPEEDITKPVKYKEKAEDHIVDDEDNDDEESAVAASVTEEVEPLGKCGKKKSDALEKKLADDEKIGQINIVKELMPTKDERTASLINPLQQQNNEKKAYKAKLTRDYKAKHANDEKPVEVKVEQKPLFDVEKLKQDYKNEAEERKEPVAFADLAWTEAKDRLKASYKEAKDGQRKEPYSFSDLAWKDVKDRLKKEYKENK